MAGIFYRFHLLLNPDSTCEVLMLTAKDIMTRDVLSVSPDTSIEELSSILVKNEISGVPVVDDAGALYGIVTENDLISRNKRLHIPTVVSFLDAAIYLESSKKFEQEVKRLTATRVGDICSRKVVTIAEDTTVTDIATIMSEKKAHLLPVLRGGKVVGIVGKRDMVKAVARQAE
jgi:CBS domain-containing protein